MRGRVGKTAPGLGVCSGERFRHLETLRRGKYAKPYRKAANSLSLRQRRSLYNAYFTPNCFYAPADASHSQTPQPLRSAPQDAP